MGTFSNRSPLWSVSTTGHIIFFIELCNGDDLCCTWLLCIDFSPSITENHCYFSKIKYEIKFILDLHSFSEIPSRDCFSQGVFPIRCVELSSPSCPSTNFPASFPFLPLPGDASLGYSLWGPVLGSSPFGCTDHDARLHSFSEMRGGGSPGAWSSPGGRGVLGVGWGAARLSQPSQHPFRLRFPFKFFIFFYVSSFSLLGLSLSFWTVGKMISNAGSCSVLCYLIFFFSPHQWDLLLLGEEPVK